jgi:hypothetical protein
VLARAAEGKTCGKAKRARLSFEKQALSLGFGNVSIAVF